MSAILTSSQSRVLATSKPLRIADSAKVKCCGRCGNTYTTESKRPPVFKLCRDCKDVCQAWERRLYKVTAPVRVAS